ncbi:MAG: putative immunity protein [Longibaculum sp.]
MQKKHYLPLYTKKESSLYQTLEKCESYLDKKCSLQELKPFLKEARADAKDITDPIVEAASKAIATACATLQTPTNALGFLFYGSAATAYHQAGLLETRETYDQLALQELQNALHSLQQYAKDKPHPIHIKWHCK